MGVAGIIGNPVGTKGYTTSGMNSLTKSGIYNCYNASDDVESLNYPTESRYWLLVVFVTETWVAQLAVGISGNGSFYIRKGATDGTFSPWAAL